MTLQALTHVQTTRDGVVNRRTFLRSLAARASSLGLMGTLAAHAQELRRREMSCILLFMNGGPSQFETFDPKPGHTNGGPTTAINTAVNNIRIASPWTNVAREMKVDVLLSNSLGFGGHNVSICLGRFTG